MLSNRLAADRPDPLPQPLRFRALNAASRVRRRYPGPAGEILASELRAYSEMGYLADSATAASRLIDELMVDEPADNIQ